MGKKSKITFINTMKEWPKQNGTINYSEMIYPIKQILIDGYKLVRKRQLGFIYKGYNIGKKELETSPSGEERFSFKWLDNENKNNRTLIDNILTIVFQLGIEQGRRIEKKEAGSFSLLEKIINSRTNKIKELEKTILKLQGKEAEEIISTETENPDLQMDIPEEDIVVDN